MKSALGGIVKKVAAGAAAVGILGFCYADRCAAADCSDSAIHYSNESGPDRGGIAVDKIHAVTDLPTLILMHDKYPAINSNPDLTKAALAKYDGFVGDFGSEAHPYSLDGANHLIEMRELLEMRSFLLARSGATLPSNDEIVNSSIRRSDRLEKLFGVPTDSSVFVNYVLKNAPIGKGVDTRALGRRGRGTSDVASKSVEGIKGLPGLVAFYEQNKSRISSDKKLFGEVKRKCGELAGLFSHYVNNAPTLDDALNLAYVADSFPEELIPSGVSLPSRCDIVRTGIENQLDGYGKFGVDTVGYRKVMNFVRKANRDEGSEFYGCVSVEGIARAGKERLSYGARATGLKNIMENNTGKKPKK